MISLSDDKQADVIDAFNTTSRYLDDILNINNVYFDNMVSQIYPSELQLNKTNTSDTETAFLDLHLSISNDIVSTKTYDKRDNLDFEIVNFPFLEGDVPRSTSYGVYISQLICFARASSHVADFSTRNKLLTQKLLILNFIDDTMIWYLNSKLDLSLSCAMDFRNLNSMVTWCINWRRLSVDEMVGAWYFGCLSGPPGFTCWISFTPVLSFIYVESLSMLHLLVISWFVCSGRWCIDKLGVCHANQIFMCLDPHLN